MTGDLGLGEQDWGTDDGGSWVLMMGDLVMADWGTDDGGLGYR